MTMSELPEGWKLRCTTPDEYERLQKIILEGKTMDSAKKSVAKILEIAKKHGYDCVVAFKKGDDAYAGMNEMKPWYDGIDPTFGKAFYEAANTVQGTPLATDASDQDNIKIVWGDKDGE